MSIAELGAIIAVVATVGGIVARAVSGVQQSISASERRLEAQIAEAQNKLNQITLCTVPWADFEKLQRKTRAIEVFLAKNFSVDLDRYDMD